MKAQFFSLPIVILIPNLLALSESQFQNASPSSCSLEQEKETPCRCCKIGCWYTIAAIATHELGHIPGQAGEEEAMATLRLIRSCMISECSELCPRMSRGLFKPMA